MADTITQVAPQSQTHGYQHGAFVWHELQCHDVAKAKAFYGPLFGWTFEDVPMSPEMTYTLIYAGKQQVGGMCALPASELPAPHWVGYVSVPDVDAAAKAVAANGGKVLHGPDDIPNIGRFAVAADPRGAVFNLYRSANGDPPEDFKQLGIFCWDTLTCDDLAAVKGFYKAVIGWEALQEPDGPDAVFKMGELMEASLVQAPAGVPVHWVTHVTVADLAKARQQAVAAGAEVMREEIDVPYGSFAVVKDPTGAVICPFQGKEMPD